MKNKTSNRRLIFQLAAVVVLIVIAYAMTIVGRGHTVYLDNKKLEYNGKTYDTPYKVVVLVASRSPSSMTASAAARPASARSSR